jgi:hypothetical protein
MSHSSDAFFVLPPDIIAKVKESEMANPNRSKSYWTCGHCTVNFGNLESREIVVAHLKSMYVSSFTFTYPSPLLVHCFSLFVYLPGTGLTRLASLKIYSSSHETRLSILLRQDTRMIHPSMRRGPSAACNVPKADRAIRLGCSI